jgi:YHS domain-containing protein
MAVVAVLLLAAARGHDKHTGSVMAQIDPSIAMGFRPVQIESPVNQMAAIAQLQSAQQQQQMNALKMQEYQQQVKEKNALAQLMANKQVPYGSDAFYSQLATVAPSFYEKIATGEAQRQTALSTKQQREAAIDKSKFDLEQAKKKEEIDTLDLRLKQFNEAFPAYNIKSEQDVEDRIVAMANDEILGPLSTRFGTLGDTIARNKAEFRRDPRNYVARTSGMSAEKIFQAAEEKEQADFSQDQLNRVINKQPLISIEEWRAGQRQPQAAPVSAATTSVSADAAMPTEAAVTTADGSKQLPGASFKADVGGVDFLDPTAQALYTLASDPKNKDRAPALKAMAEKIQAEHVKRLEEDRKRNQLTGDFLNVVNARKQIAELKKNPTPLNLAIIADLEQQIKAANEGKGTRVNVGVKLPEGVKAVDQKYAQDYLDWSQGGGADAAANAAQIKLVLDRLAAGENLTGPSIGLAPDFFNALVNPQALGAKQAVEEVVQRNLRAVLGPQFTQVEGERLISRAFDARLKPQENVKRLRKLFLQMQTAAQQKQAMAEYFEANETLRGFKGKQPKMQDFFDVLTAPDAPPKGSVDVRAPDGKVYRFSDQQAADKFKKDNGIKD